jgi:hypothetical protein
MSGHRVQAQDKAKDTLENRTIPSDGRKSIMGMPDAAVFKNTALISV